MKVFMLWKYYQQYLSYFYKKTPAVIELSFNENRNKLFDDHFGWPADLCRYMNNKGIQTEFVVANDKILQKKWAGENGFQHYSHVKWEKEIALKQIKSFSPDILWIPSIFDYYGDFVHEALQYCKKVITWVGSPWPPPKDVTGISVLLTENPNTFHSIQDRFEKVICTKPGFDPEILEKLGPATRKHDLTFIGGISDVHTKRAEILAYLLINGIDINIFGNTETPPGRLTNLKACVRQVLRKTDFQKAVEGLKYSFTKSEFQRNFEIIQEAHQGQSFGMDMYRTLASSKMTLNIHSELAGKNAGNMRMFESTGVGTCLLTEHSQNITDLFIPSEEVLTYSSKDELPAIIRNMLQKPDKIQRISSAGQKKTLSVHTIERMFHDIQPAFEM